LMNNPYLKITRLCSLRIHFGPVCLEEFGWFEGMLEEFMREKYGSG